MYGENTNTIAIPIYRVLPYPVILQYTFQLTLNNDVQVVTHSQAQMWLAFKTDSSELELLFYLLCRDHRKLFVGDSRGRVYTWVVSDTQGIYMFLFHA